MGGALQARGIRGKEGGGSGITVGERRREPGVCVCAPRDPHLKRASEAWCPVAASE